MPSVFLLGGARSGKSALSEQLAQGWALQSDRCVTAVVTAEAIDSEMQARIERHQADRPAGWTTVEAPYALLETIGNVPPDRILVLDCLTVWLTNLLVRGDEPALIEAAAQAVAKAIAERTTPSIVVSNELGLGVVPVDQMTRSFRDIQGRANQAMAATLDHAYFVVAGRALALESATTLIADL